MRIQHANLAAANSATDLLVVVSFGKNLDANARKLDGQLDGLLARRAKEEGFKGGRGQSVLLDTRYDLKGKRLLLLGGGDKKSCGAAEVRDLAATAIKTGNSIGARDVIFSAPETKGQPVYFAALGAIQGGYAFTKYKSEKKPPSVKKFTVSSGVRSAIANDCIRRAKAVGAAVCRARDFVNEPAEFMNPSQMAREARALAKKYPRLTCKIFSRQECAKMRMGMFLAVGRGAAEEPKLVHLTYKPKGKAKKVVTLVGKGVMFDSGGYSLKPSAAMEDMKIDMAGSAAVVAAIGAIAEIGCDYEVHAVAACCENMVAGDAYKLGDVLKAMDGTTVEINNTDAEGRLTLGDAITYARTKTKADEIFDFATLTGACMVALGPYTAAVMTKKDDMAKRWMAAAEAAGENFWRLPLQEKLKEQLKSSIADMKNTGERWGGAITAGLFLSHFAKDTNHLHVDLAGPASASRDQPSIPRGGTGFAVATIVEYLTR
jgi:leucyl aminopeptidase